MKKNIIYKTGLITLFCFFSVYLKSENTSCKNINPRAVIVDSQGTRCKKLCPKTGAADSVPTSRKKIGLKKTAVDETISRPAEVLPYYPFFIEI
jgi:hypothetical protein